MQRLLQSLMKRQTLGSVVINICELVRIQDTQRYEEIRGKQKLLSEVTNMIHSAHVFHRCVSVNRTQDDVLSLLVGDYLLAKSSVDMASLRHPRTVGLIAKGLEDYTSGEFLKLSIIESLQKKQIRLNELQDGLRRYAELTCGSLLSNACLSAALLAGHTNESDDLSNLIYSFGLYTGSAQRFIEMLYCPNDNDRNFISQLTLSPSQLDNYLRNYLDKSSDILESLPDSKTRQSLSAVLNEMRQYLPT